MPIRGCRFSAVMLFGALPEAAPVGLVFADGVVVQGVAVGVSPLGSGAYVASALLGVEVAEGSDVAVMLTGRVDGEDRAIVANLGPLLLSSGAQQAEVLGELAERAVDIDPVPEQLPESAEHLLRLALAVNQIRGALRGES